MKSKSRQVLPTAEAIKTRGSERSRLRRREQVHEGKQDGQSREEHRTKTLRQGIQVLIWLYETMMLLTAPSQPDEVCTDPSLATKLVPIPPDDGLPLEVLLAHTSASYAAAVQSRLGRGEVLARALYRQYFAAHGRSTSMETVDLPAELLASPHLCVRLLGLSSLTSTLSFAASTPPVAPAEGATEKYVLLCLPKRIRMLAENTNTEP